MDLVPNNPQARLLAVALVGLLPAAAAAQARWTIDPKTSLVWWQMSPHLNHLWATTCPQDPSWRPGENRSSGWNINHKLKLPKGGSANVDDTVNVPLYPRDTVQSLCNEAVQGEVLLPDTVTWRDARGEVTATADALISGETMRDVMMHQVLETKKFPKICFTLDSLVHVTRQGSRLVGSAVGTLTVRGGQQRVTAEVEAFPDAGGMRVLAKWHFPVETLMRELAPKVLYRSLGGSTNLWHDFFMGADLVFRTKAPAGT